MGRAYGRFLSTGVRPKFMYAPGIVRHPPALQRVPRTRHVGGLDMNPLLYRHLIGVHRRYAPRGRRDALCRGKNKLERPPGRAHRRASPRTRTGCSKTAASSRSPWTTGRACWSRGFFKQLRQLRPLFEQADTSLTVRQLAGFRAPGAGRRVPWRRREDPRGLSAGGDAAGCCPCSGCSGGASGG